MTDISVLEIEHHQGAFAEFHTGLDGFQTTFFIDIACNKAVHDNFDIVGFVAVELDTFTEFEQFAIDPNAGVTHALNLLKKFSVVAFSSFDFWRQ